MSKSMMRWLHNDKKQDEGRICRMCRMKRKGKKTHACVLDCSFSFFPYPAHPAYPLLSCFHFAPQQHELCNGLNDEMIQ